MKIKIIGILICLLFIVSSISAAGDFTTKKCQNNIIMCSQEKTGECINSFDNYKTVGNNPYVKIETTMGSIVIELYEDLVPITVENFLKLINDSFFDGLVFHRVINDFVIQGGGYYPDGNRKESPYGPIDLEIHPDARHVNGAIGMARTSDPNSATNQFYICDGPQHFLDDEYAVFGVVRVGMNIVRKIAAVDTTTKYGLKDWPVNDVIINSLRVNAKSLDVGESISPKTISLLYQAQEQFLNLFEIHPNLFPLLQKILQQH